MARLAPQHHWTRWNATYQGVLPYLQEVFGRFLEELGPRLQNPFVRAKILPLVQELCNPDLSLRGHPRGLGRPNQYSLERYVSQLTNTVQMLEIKTKAERRTV